MGRWIDGLEWVQRWQASGLTQAEFRRLHQLKRSTFASWLRRSRLESGEAAATGVAEPLITPPAASTIVPAQWPIPVATHLQLSSPSGVILTLPAATDPDWLAALLRGLS